ncbi:MarC family protein [Tropicimonas sp. TH_r6]|uniref:MarC family protein n=1 Tax=Tropicimonas sp. TH_r6 TaxID=3082085 RepID=UPI0029554D80|nr:MarC family protein [Tropicimonas sp. TH_r6]MDV7145148.1 MarC family protein [Tropicimonas sp. TH_r6]
MEPDFAIKFFGALFAIMNPITNLPVFLGVTEGAPPQVQRAIALKTASYVTIMGVVIAFAGSAILKLFGIGVDDFRVAGGLVVLLIALNMLNGGESASHHGTEGEKDSYPDAATVAFYPLTFPILVGPGTITTLILFSSQAQGLGGWITYFAVFGGIVAAIALVFWFAGDIGKHLSGTAKVIMSRLMGMILAAIAIDMIATGLKTLLPGLA